MKVKPPDSLPLGNNETEKGLDTLGGWRACLPSSRLTRNVYSPHRVHRSVRVSMETKHRGLKVDDDAAGSMYVLEDQFQDGSSSREITFAPNC